MDAEFTSFISRCITVDESTRVSFFTEYGGIAEKYLYKHFPSLSFHEIEVIIQNIFVNLARVGLRAFRGSTRNEFLAYFKTITLNKAKDHLRKRQRLELVISIDQESDPEAGAGEGGDAEDANSCLHSRCH